VSTLVTVIPLWRVSEILLIVVEIKWDYEENIRYLYGRVCTDGHWGGKVLDW
jgi:hypothetical protein